MDTFASFYLIVVEVFIQVQRNEYLSQTSNCKIPLNRIVDFIDRLYQSYPILSNGSADPVI